MSVTLCNYCATSPVIPNSHVVPRFLGTYIKNNSPFGHMLNLWEKKTRIDLYKGPYLCANCDNQIFSSWENYYSRNVWPDPLNVRSQWGEVRTINFFVSLAYRYAIHFLATSPIPANAAYSTYFRDLTKKALKTSAEIGKSMFVYPYVHRAITNECALLTGVNHLLNLGVHGQSLPREGDLPNSMLVITPKVLLLFCESKMGVSADCTMKSPMYLSVGVPFDPLTENTDMPVFLATILNRLVGQGQGHQKELGRWKRLAYGTDKLLNPSKMCYQANASDQALWDWQKVNCRPKS